MEIGVSGSSRGGTPAQLATARYLVAEVLHPSSVHHGDCVGWDEQMHDLTAELREEGVRVWSIAHPPDDDRKRAHCAADVIRDPKPYLARDMDIAYAGVLLLAAPARDDEPRSTRGDGAWTTIRYARDKARRPVWIIRRDGTIRIEIPA